MVFDGITSDQVTSTHKLIKMLRKLKLAAYPVLQTKKATNANLTSVGPPFKIVCIDYIDDLSLVDLENELYDLLFENRNTKL